MFEMLMRRTIRPSLTARPRPVAHRLPVCAVADVLSRAPKSAAEIAPPFLLL